VEVLQATQLPLFVSRETVISLLAYLPSVSGRLMTILCMLLYSGIPADGVNFRPGHHRFLNFYGQPGARLDFTHSVHGKKRQRSYLIRVLSPLLFYTPDSHLQSLDELWVDELLRLVSWNKFIEKLDHEWVGLILYATILLNANVAFLAIPGVNNGQVGVSRSASQQASYLSITSSLGSIILGLLNTHQNRSRSYDYAVGARHSLSDYSCLNTVPQTDFLFRVTHPVYGLEVLAILYALPYALLMWG